MRRLSWRQAMAYALGLLTATAGFAVGAAWAGHAATGGSVQACVSREHGTLYLQNVRNKRQPCDRGDQTIVWAITGPQGPQGQQGTAGTPGANGAPGAPGAQGPAGQDAPVLGYECQQLFPEGSSNGTETTMYWPCTPNSANG